MDPRSETFFCDKTTTKNASEFSEESGWTMYFDEDLSTGYETSHSSAPETAFSGEKVAGKGGVTGRKMGKSCRKLSKKKWKKEGFEEDDALEDTATSPYSYSKVKQEKEEEMSQWNRRAMDLVDRDSKLKKKGLCLVPLSFAFTHFG